MPGRRRLQLMGFVLALLPALLLPGEAVSHNGEQRPPPPPPPPPAPYVRRSVDHLYPPRWSWIHWWEANRDAYLEPLRQERPNQANRDQTRLRVLQAVRVQLKGAAPVRAAAALALGRMGDLESFEALRDVQANDPDQWVRVNAVVAIGLLGDEAAETFLFEAKYPTIQLRNAGYAALSLLEQLQPATAAGLTDAVAQGDVPTATMAAWTLEDHGDAFAHAFLHRTIQRAPSPWVASSALIALGQRDEPDPRQLTANIELLSSVLLAGGGPNPIESIAHLNTIHRRKHATAIVQQEAASIRSAVEEYRRAHAEFMRYSPNERQRPGPDELKVLLGLETTYIAEVRAAAAIGLGFIDDPRAIDALIRAIRIDDDEDEVEYHNLFKGMAIMSLGQLGAEQSVETLLGLMSPVGPRNVAKKVAEMESPLRGYAALALGLYCRPVATPQGMMDRQRVAEVAELLAERIADARETPEVRCAAAMALGLSNRTVNLRYLRIISDKVPINDELLAGYIILARGMLGDGNIIEPATRLLAVDKTDMRGILARRAAALGLGLLAKPQVIPILVEAWHLNHYVNREVIVAMSFCEAQSVTDEVLDLLETAEDDFERAYLVSVLGEMHAVKQPNVRGQRLSMLVRDSNYMMRNDWQLPMRSMANAFLFEYLIGQWGDQWQ